jgi:hypothetical protein
MSHLAHLVLATMCQSTGKRYPSLEPLMETMTEPQLQDLLRLVRDVADQENRRMQSKVQRMTGIPRGIIR